MGLPNSFFEELAEFERDLMGERIRSSIAAQTRGRVKTGRRIGQRAKASHLDKSQVLQLVDERHSYSPIVKALHISKNTMRGIMKRHR